MAPDPSTSTGEVYTIPQLAERIGVTAQSVRNWIRSGRIEPPEEIPATGEKVYSAEAADRIEHDYMIRAAHGGTRGPGAAERREHARAWLEDHGVEPDENGTGASGEKQVLVLPEGSPAATVDAAVRRWLVLEDYLPPVIPLVVAVANRLAGPPVWLMIVAPPSSGKSEVIRGINALKGVRHISTITSSTFASGMIPRSGSDKSPSLLERMEQKGQWLLTLKDFGTIQSVQRETRNEIFGQLREIYDGQFDATYGTGVEVNWHGKIGMLVGATPAVDRQYKWSAELGERFVQFRPVASDPEEVALKAVKASDEEDEKNRAIKEAYRAAFDKIAPTASSAPEFHKRRLALVAALARFTAAARRPVHHERGRGGFQVLEPEGPARLAKVFAQLFKAALLCFDGNDQLALRVVSRIAVDCVPGRRGRLLRTLAEKPQGVTAEVTSGRLGCDTETARTELREVRAIGLAESEKPAHTDIYSASERLYEAAADIYPNAKNHQQALAILCDRRNNRSPERERKKEDKGKEDE